MVAEMHRLEQAARLSMGNFQDAEAPAMPLKRPLLSLRYAVGTVAVLVFAAALYQLF